MNQYVTILPVLRNIPRRNMRRTTTSTINSGLLVAHYLEVCFDSLTLCVADMKPRGSNTLDRDGFKTVAGREARERPETWGKRYPCAGTTLIRNCHLLAPTADAVAVANSERPRVHA